MSEELFSKEEMEQLKELIKEKPTLDKLVRKEESWTYVTSRIKGIAMWVTTVFAGLTAFWYMLVEVVKWKH